MRTAGRFLVVLVLGGLALGAGLALLAPQAEAILGASESRPVLPVDLEPLAERSMVYARDGSVLAVLHAEVNREPVPLTRVPSVVVDAILDVEDERFWRHGGLDLRSMLRALFANLEAGRVAQGGSTITQQLVKNALLTSNRTAGRKVKEAVLALRLEDRMPKRTILERYLNTVYFGNGVYGVQAAAERYFGVDVGELSAGQAALLAGIIRNPVGYDPFVHRDAARSRWRFALDRMVRAGHLTPARADAFARRPLPESPVDLLPEPDDYFVEEVKQRLLDDRRLGDTEAERYNAVFKGGLAIRTTLDPSAQRIAQEKVTELLPDTGGKFTAALVAVDPGSGAVRALVGGPGFEQAKYNLATQGHRQAGSAFKPFTLVAALEAGHSPRSTISGHSPCSIPNPGGTPDPWRPDNYEGTKGGTMTLADATARSVNCAYARLASIVGVDRIADVAERMGIVTELDRVPAMTLGALGRGVSPLEMASAYATLAAEGVRHRPYFVEEVVDRSGRRLLTERGEGEQVVDPQVARLATSVLRDVVNRGTGTRARLSGRPTAGKTGTTQEWRDAWFVGYVPQLTTAVWMGSPVAEESMRNVGGIRVTGGSYPARIWGAFMAEWFADAPVLQFREPDPRLIPKARYLRVKGEKAPPTTIRRRARPTPRVTTTVAAPPSTADPGEPT